MDWPLAIAAVLFLGAYSWQVIGQPTGAAGDLAYGVVLGVWVFFIVDYLVTLVLVEDRWRWFWRHFFDFAVIVLPIFRPLRVLRAITVLHVLNRTVGGALRGRILVYTVSASALLVYGAALAVLDAERGSGSDIDSFPDALWWAFVTVTTVGYGDLSPVSGVGRVLAVFLMLGGIALLGVVTGTVASWIVDRVSTDVDENQTATVAHIKELHATVAELRDEVRGLRAERDADEPSEESGSTLPS